MTFPSSSATLKRFPAKWKPVRVKKTRQIGNLEPRSDSIGTEKALAQRIDDFPISCLRKRLQRARPDGSKHAQLQAETCRHGIVRSFVDRDHVNVTHGQVKRFELAVHLFEGFLRSVQTTW